MDLELDEICDMLSRQMDYTYLRKAKIAHIFTILTQAPASGIINTNLSMNGENI